MAEAQNIPVGSTTAGQIAVAAESTVATRMSAPASFDVADFPVPHGREEEWRFTPLERLRELFGLYFTDAGQHQEHRLLVDHNVPHCKSNAVYKGALQGDDAHAVWIGDVLIEAAAEGTDTYEMNRNLVLTDGARVDSVPNLEIETGEIVGAGHASATGRFDDEQLFYLMARGIPELDARRLVVHGFFAELVQQIGVADIEERLLAKIAQELEASVA